jgi:hypothetical protein
MKLTEPMGMELGHVTLEVKGATKGGQAARLGVLPGWRVLQVGGEEVYSFDEFLEKVGKLKASGEKATTLLFDMPDLNTIALNKDASTFRESVFSEESTAPSKFNVSGYLQKKGTNLVSPWQSRYFVAQGHYLKYYKSEDVAGKKDYCLAAIDLDLCEVKDAVGKCFDLVLLESEVTSLKANSDAEAKKWVSALRTLRMQYGNQTFEPVEEEAEDEVEDDDGPDVAIQIPQVTQQVGGQAPMARKSIPYDSLVAGKTAPLGAPGAGGGAAMPQVPTTTIQQQQKVAAPVVPPAKALTAEEIQELAWQEAERKEAEKLKQQAEETSQRRTTMLAGMATTNINQAMEAGSKSSGGGGGGGGKSMGGATAAPVPVGPLPEKTQLNKKPVPESLKRQEVPEHLKPAAGEVNPLTNKPLSTAPVGQERKVSRRRSITSRKCRAGEMNGTECNILHFRDSPFCHEHANMDPSTIRSSAGGTSELEDTLNRALEIALDRKFGVWCFVVSHLLFFFFFFFFLCVCLL